MATPPARSRPLPSNLRWQVGDRLGGSAAGAAPLPVFGVTNNGVEAYYLCMTKIRETIDGLPVTEEMIQAWANEAEAGYEVEKLHAPRRGRPSLGQSPGVQLSVRLEPELAELLSQSAAERHISKSVLIREAVRHYLHAS